MTYRPKHRHEAFPCEEFLGCRPCRGGLKMGTCETCREAFNAGAQIVERRPVDAGGRRRLPDPLAVAARSIESR